MKVTARAILEDPVAPHLLSPNHKSPTLRQHLEYMANFSVAAMAEDYTEWSMKRFQVVRFARIEGYVRAPMPVVVRFQLQLEVSATHQIQRCFEDSAILRIRSELMFELETSCCNQRLW